MIFEPYLGCYGSIFSPDLVCRSWDYGLSAKSSPICNRMSGTWSNYQFILWKHITLICQHDKLPLVRWYYFTYWNICTNRLSQKALSLSIFKFSQYLCHDQESTLKLFNMITQPWRHPGAILWIHVIIHIFITIHSKSTIFNAHKLQAICQHIGLFISGLYQIRARARASKFRNAQNHL